MISFLRSFWVEIKHALQRNGWSLESALVRAQCSISSWFPLFKGANHFSRFVYTCITSCQHIMHASDWVPTLSFLININTLLFNFTSFIHLYPVLKSIKTIANLYPSIDWAKDASENIYFDQLFPVCRSCVSLLTKMVWFQLLLIHQSNILLYRS